jgi:hypothetical protein
MTEHLVQYYGASLFPVMVAYGGGWLAALAVAYPELFESRTGALGKDNKTSETLRDGVIRTLYEAFYGKDALRENHLPSEGALQEYLLLYAPRCGCSPYTQE